MPRLPDIDICIDQKLNVEQGCTKGCTKGLTEKKRLAFPFDPAKTNTTCSVHHNHSSISRQLVPRWKLDKSRNSLGGTKTAMKSIVRATVHRAIRMKSRQWTMKNAAAAKRKPVKEKK
jgi:hypothetical protein